MKHSKNSISLYGIVFATILTQQCYSSHNQDLCDYQKAVDYHLRRHQYMKKFVQSCTPPYDLLKRIIMDEPVINEKLHWYNSKQKDIYVKDYDITRPLFASFMKQYINEKEYKHVAVPDKYLVLMKNGLRVVTQKIDYRPMNSDTNITLDQMRDITDVVMALGYTDLVKPYSDQQNLVINNRNNKFTFIDTDSCAFDTSKSRALCAVLALDQQLEICGVSLDDDANDLLNTRISEAEEGIFTALYDRNILEEFLPDYVQIKTYRNNYY